MSVPEGARPMTNKIVLPRHTFDGECNALPLWPTNHVPMMRGDDVFCKNCNAHAVIEKIARAKPVAPKSQPLHRNLYVNTNDVEAHEDIMERFRKHAQFDEAHLYDERDTIPWRVYMRGSLAALAKPVNRQKGLNKWGDREDYSFEAERWDRMIAKRDRDFPTLPIYLIVQIAATKEAGYVEVADTNVSYRSTYGARGVENRGDQRDGRTQVHIKWPRFTRILP